MKKRDLLGNYWVMLLASLILAAIGGYVGSFFMSNIIPPTALTFAISNQILTGIRLKTIKSEFNVEKVNILKHYLNDKIGLARSLCDKQNDSALVYCLGSLEFLATEISKCCDKKEDKDKFKIIKGLLGSTKTTFSKVKYDSTIEKPYADVVESVSQLETYLNDI